MQFLRSQGPSQGHSACKCKAGARTCPFWVPPRPPGPPGPISSASQPCPLDCTKDRPNGRHGLMGPELQEPSAGAARSALKRKEHPTRGPRAPHQRFLFLGRRPGGCVCAFQRCSQGMGGTLACRFCTKQGSVTSPEGGKQKDASSFASMGLLPDPESSQTTEKFPSQPGLGFS